jgi:hypothetical protein
MTNTKLQKFQVCDKCWSVDIVDLSCVCSYGKYKTIQLEFEVCECCGKLIADGTPADTPFNDEQLKKIC